MKDIIYFNGDSWTDNVFFKKKCYDNFSKNFWVINSSVSGNWNSQIIKSSVDDFQNITTCLNSKTKIHAFIFLSEWLRSENELMLLKQAKKEIYADAEINNCLEYMSNKIITDFKKRFFHVSSLNLHISTAFIDCKYDTVAPMYLSILKDAGLESNKKCYSISYLNKFTNEQFIKMGFTKNNCLDFLESSLDRCKLLESIEGIKDYHISDSNLYNPVINQIKNFL